MSATFPRDLIIAAATVEAAQIQLERYAESTDAPREGVVEAADLLDKVQTLLTRGAAR